MPKKHVRRGLLNLLVRVLRARVSVADRVTGLRVHQVNTYLRLKVMVAPVVRPGDLASGTRLEHQPQKLARL